jgi:hypothetical protein
MSARNLTALGFSIGIGVITGLFSIRHGNIRQVLRNLPGVYIFQPTLQEEQKSNELWRNPGYVVSRQLLAPVPTVDVKQSSKSGKHRG